MFRLLLIWFCSGWFVFISAQSAFDNFTVEYPELVHQGKSFQISIITSNESKNVDRLDLYLSPKQGIFTSKINVRSENETKEIKFSETETDEFSENAVKCSINLAEIISNSSGSFFQILIDFKTVFVEYSEIDFYGEFWKGNTLVGHLNTSDETLHSDYSNQYRLKVNFYNSNGNAEKAIKLQENSEFKISSESKIENDLLVDFWVKLDQTGNRFFEIINKQSGLSEFRLIHNKFQIIIPESDFNREMKITPHFISTNVWTHFTLLFSFQANELRIYCGKKLMAVFELNNTLTANNIIFSFMNSGKSGIEIDQFKILDYNDPVEVAFNNSNFTSFLSANSSVKKQISFNTSLSELIKDETLLVNNGAIVSSDAPIFSRAPELNINIMNNYYELTWLGGDFSNVKTYVLEQAEDDGNYKEIYRADADNFDAKTYSFLSEKKPDFEVLFFRINQVNKDGSQIYSSQVKVGQGELIEFNLEQNYPNPFNPKTEISIEVLIDSEFIITIYNLEGKRISVLHDGFLAAGKYQFTFDGSDLPSGIYLYEAWSPNFSQTKKMILAK